MAGRTQAGRQRLRFQLAEEHSAQPGHGFQALSPDRAEGRSRRDFTAPPRPEAHRRDAPGTARCERLLDPAGNGSQVLRFHPGLCSARKSFVFREGPINFSGLSASNVAFWEARPVERRGFGEESLIGEELWRPPFGR